MKPLLFLTLFIISFPAFSQKQKQQPQTGFTTSFDSVKIAYEVFGEPKKQGLPTLVFIHGWSCDRSYWSNQMDFFSKRLKVVSIDLAGHGESGIERSAWTMQSFGEDVAAVVKKLDLHRIILIGHSMGGDVIAEAALRLRDRTVGLVMVDTYKKLGPGRSPESVEAFMATLRPDFSGGIKDFVRMMFLANSDKELVEKVAADMSAAPPAIGLASAEAAMHYSREMPGTLKKLQLPVIAINPDNEPTDEASMQQHGLEVMIVPGVGHFLMMEDPDHFNTILMEAIHKLTR